MAQKNAMPTKAQQAAIKRAGLDPREWTVKKELPSQLIIIHRHDKTAELINKKAATGAGTSNDGKPNIDGASVAQKRS